MRRSISILHISCSEQAAGIDLVLAQESMNKYWTVKHQSAIRKEMLRCCWKSYQFKKALKEQKLLANLT